MDVNGLPMWLLADAASFGTTESLEWIESRAHLALAAQQDRPVVGEDEMFARRMISRPSPVADHADTFAWWNMANQAIEASGFAPGMVTLPLGTRGTLEDPAPVFPPSDMALGDDQILMVARDGQVILRDLRDRFPSAVAARAGFTADLVAPRPGGGGWAFDKARRRLALIKGQALREIGLRAPDPERFDPVDPNRSPPRIEPFRAVALPAGFDAVALAASPDGRLALLAWQSGADAALFLLEGQRFALLGRTAGLQFPWSLAWLDGARLAIMASDRNEIAAQAFVYATGALGTDRDLLPEGRTYPLRDPWHGKFCNALGEEPRYLSAPRAGAPPQAMRRLLPLSGVRYARRGTALAGPIDSGSEGCVWHRFFAEAAVPSHCRIVVAIHASDSAAPPKPPGQAGAPPWALHRIGARQPGEPPLAAAAWCPEPSELPSCPALLNCPPRPDEAGLFDGLIQHADRRVRRVAGRYAWLHLSFEGDSRDSPELAAIRIYARRFSYRDRYLPDFYGENLTAGEGAAGGTASPADFLERMLGLFEGNLTELEGKVAGSWLLTDPAAAPEPALPWIGSWIGMAERRGERPALLRERLLAAPHTALLHGTLGGLLGELELATGGRYLTGGTIDGDAPPESLGSLVLARIEGTAIRALLIGHDRTGGAAILTGGAVTRGDIVAVEGFALRRTFATILGADLADEDDPLTLGLATSGNSYVGDTLILGESARSELLALWRPEIDAAQSETDGVAAFFERLSHRVMILVRGVSERDELRRLTGIAEASAPAHVEVRLHRASTPLIVGAASLVGIDTYLTQEPAVQRVRLGHSMAGSGDEIRGEGWLDGRADGPLALAPIARGNAPQRVWRGAPFQISGFGSQASKGRTIDRYIWTWGP